MRFKDYYVILSDYGYSLEKKMQKYIISKGGKNVNRGFNYNSKNKIIKYLK